MGAPRAGIDGNDKGAVNVGQYLLKHKAERELGRILKSKANYSFGGSTSFVKLKHIKPRLA